MASDGSDGGVVGAGGRVELGGCLDTLLRKIKRTTIVRHTTCHCHEQVQGYGELFSVSDACAVSQRSRVPLAS